MRSILIQEETDNEQFNLIPLPTLDNLEIILKKILVKDY